MVNWVDYMYYKFDNTKIIERIKQNEMLDMIADKAYIEYLKSENKRLADENKRLRDVIEHLENENKHFKELVEVCKNVWEVNYGI